MLHTSRIKQGWCRTSRFARFCRPHHEVTSHPPAQKRKKKHEQNLRCWTTAVALFYTDQHQCTAVYVDNRSIPHPWLLLVVRSTAIDANQKAKHWNRWSNATASRRRQRQHKIDKFGQGSTFRDDKISRLTGQSIDRTPACRLISTLSPIAIAVCSTGIQIRRVKRPLRWGWSMSLPTLTAGLLVMMAWLRWALLASWSLPIPPPPGRGYPRVCGVLGLEAAAVWRGVSLGCMKRRGRREDM